MRSNCRCRPLPRIRHKLDRVLGSDVFKHDTQFGELLSDRYQGSVDEGFFAIKNIASRVGDFAVHEERHVVALHFTQYGIERIECSDAGGGVGGRPGGVKFYAMDMRAVSGRDNCLSVSFVREVERHERLERRVCWHVRENPLAVGERVLHGYHGRRQVWHHDRSSGPPGNVRHGSRQRRTIPQVYVPVVW